MIGVGQRIDASGIRLFDPDGRPVGLSTFGAGPWCLIFLRHLA